MEETATGDAAGTTEPTVSMTGVPTDGTTWALEALALEELTADGGTVAPALVLVTTAGPVTDGVEAEGVKWESLSEWEWRSGCCPVEVLLLLPLAVLV